MGKITEIIKDYTASYRLGRKSYAQEGEDIVLDRFFGGKSSGFYVEIGCHHPVRFSNTYLFYLKDWRGVCVDPLPGTIEKFKRLRRRDLVLEVGVSFDKSSLDYFMFNEPALNTFDKKLADERNGLGGYQIVETRKIDLFPLKDILTQRVPPDQSIDFFSIDVEGLDFQVITSNDWGKFRPKAVVVECLGLYNSHLEDNQTVSFMKSVGYYFYAKTGGSVIFVKTDE